MEPMPITTSLHANFCRNLRRRMAACGVTQVELAERLGIAQPSVSAIIRGRREPGLGVIDRVAQALDCSPQSLLAESAEE